MSRYYDPDAIAQPDHPIGVGMVLADLRELAQFGANIAERMLREPPIDPIVWLDQIDATLRQCGIAEPDMDLARGAVLRAVEAVFANPSSR